jgi:hypothetical protein
MIFSPTYSKQATKLNICIFRHTRIVKSILCWKLWFALFVILFILMLLGEPLVHTSCYLIINKTLQLLVRNFPLFPILRKFTWPCFSLTRNTLYITARITRGYHFLHRNSVTGEQKVYRKHIRQEIGFHNREETVYGARS